MHRKARGGDGVCFTIDDEELDDIHYEPFTDDEPPPDPWAIGMRVTHPKFGSGVIRGREGAGEEMKLTVNFKKIGPKKLALKYAKLTPEGGGCRAIRLAPEAWFFIRNSDTFLDLSLQRDYISIYEY